MRRSGAGVVVVILWCLITGCGYKTSPRPASATVPGEVGLIKAHGYPDRIVLTWNVPLSNIDGSQLTDLSGFKVYRSSQEVGEECENCDRATNVHANVDVQNPFNAAISNGEVVYSDREVGFGRAYHYAVAAYSLKGREGPRSHMVTVVFDSPPAVPENLKASYDERGIVLKWDPPVNAARIGSYRVYRAETQSAADMKPVGNTKWAETYFVDRGVEKGKTYFYVVRSAKMNGGISLESAATPTLEAAVPPEGR